MNEIMEILSPVLGDELAKDVIAHRAARETVKPFDTYRAKITLNVLMKSPDPKLAAWEYLNREANAKELTVEYLKACLEYNPETGVFTRRIYRGHNSLPGTEINAVGNHGYIETALAGKLYLGHRLAWFHQTGEWPDFIDHIDRDKLNNSFGNLRSCTAQENSWNHPRHPRNTSGVKGVSWDSRSKKWLATIRADGKTQYLGKFNDKDEAANAYNGAVVKYRGHFLEAAQ